MKLRVYEYLHLFNQNLKQALRLLQRLEKCPGLRRNFLRSFQVKIEEIRAETNHELTQSTCEREQKDWYRFAKKRHAWEKQFEDPDDVYIEVQEREQERCQQGLPPRLGILPHAEPPEGTQEREIKIGRRGSPGSYRKIQSRGFSTNWKPQRCPGVLGNSTRATRALPTRRSIPSPVRKTSTIAPVCSKA